MKRIFLLLLVLVCSGCSTNVLDKQKYDAFNDYINVIGEKCIIYIENDETLSLREKNVYQTRHRLIKEQMNEIKIK